MSLVLVKVCPQGYHQGLRQIPKGSRDTYLCMQAEVANNQYLDPCQFYNAEKNSAQNIEHKEKP